MGKLTVGGFRVLSVCFLLQVLGATTTDIRRRGDLLLRLVDLGGSSRFVGCRELGRLLLWVGLCVLELT